MSLNTLTIEQLLQPLPHKLRVKFALYCANQVRHLMKNPKSIKALDITALWLEDKATNEDVKAAADAAYAAAYYDTATYANTASYAGYAAAYTVPVHGAPANAAINATIALKKKDDYFKPKLIEMIKQLSQLERILYELK